MGFKTESTVRDPSFAELISNKICGGTIKILLYCSMGSQAAVKV